MPQFLSACYPSTLCASRSSGGWSPREQMITGTTQERNLYHGIVDGKTVLVCRQVDDFAIACASPNITDRVITESGHWCLDQDGNAFLQQWCRRAPDPRLYSAFLRNLKIHQIYFNVAAMTPLACGHPTHVPSTS